MKKRITIYMPKNLHIKTKIYCIENKITMTELIKKGLVDLVQKCHKNKYFL